MMGQMGMPGAAPPKAEEKAEPPKPKIPKCFLHKNPNAKCKNCQRYLAAVKEAEEAEAKAKEQAKSNFVADSDAVELTNIQHFNLGAQLRADILKAPYFKTTLATLESFEAVKEELMNVTHVEPMESASVPSPFMCCLFKLFSIKLTRSQINELLESRESVYLRCAGVLYLRFGVDPNTLAPWLKNLFLDEEELTTDMEQKRRQTIGEWVEGLVQDDKYYDFLMPRIPVQGRKSFENTLIMLPQFRERAKVNARILEEFFEMEVEACSNGDWLDGKVVEVNTDSQFYPYFVVKLEDGATEDMPIGMVILKDTKEPKDSKESRDSKDKDREKDRDKDRDRDRDRGGRVDLSRSRGKSLEELKELYKEKDRDKALAVGKDYARRPVGYKSALAQKREVGTASARLIEEETFVRERPIGRRERSRSRERKRGGAPEPIEPGAASTQSFEQQMKMAELVAKYTAQPAGGSAKKDA